MEGDRPLVSFYMTVKNGVPFVADAVESIINQTYSNWEAVIVDDGSNDGTVSCLKGIARRDNRVRVIVTEGIGRGAALNLAIRESKGKMLCNLDSDDLTHPRRAELELKYLMLHREQFVCADREVFTGKELGGWWDTVRENSIGRDVTRDLMYGNPVAHGTVMIDRETLLGSGAYDETRSSQIDYELWYRLAASGVRLVRLPERLGAKRVHRGQYFENGNRVRYVLKSARLQATIISRFNGGGSEWIVLVARVVYGVLPMWFRGICRRRVGRKRDVLVE